MCIRDRNNSGTAEGRRGVGRPRKRAGVTSYNLFLFETETNHFLFHSEDNDDDNENCLHNKYV